MDKKLLYAICMVFGFGVSLYGQSQLDSITTQLIREYEKFPPEEIYLQTSKDIYETGEDLWFKAYQLNTKDESLLIGNIFEP